MWQAVVIILAIAAVAHRWWQKRILRKCNLQEADFTVLPFFGHAKLFSGGSESRMKNMADLSHEAIKKGGTLVVWFGHKMMVGIVDAGLAEYVLKTYHDKGGLTNGARMLTGNGILFAPFHESRERRKLIAPLFSPKNLSLFVEVFAKQSDTLAGLLRSTAGKPTHLWSYITKFTFDSVCHSFLGINIDVQNQPDHPFLTSFYKGFKLIAARMMNVLHYNDTVYKLTASYAEVMKHKKIMYDFILQAINSNVERDQTIKYDPLKSDKHHKTPSITELLMQTSEEGELSLIGQCEEVLVLVVAGVDTSAIGISFTLHMLARHQDVQEKVYKELKEVFGDSNREVTNEDLPKLQYLEMVIKESLRLYPPIPVISREVTEDITLASGQILPKGSLAIVSLYGIHRNPEYWGTDVDQFRPERFLEPFKHPKQFIPFSHGPRNCIGYKYAQLTMKTVIAVILRQYKIYPGTSTIHDKTNLNGINASNSRNFEIRIGAGIVIKDIDHVLLRLEIRKK